MKTFFLVYLLSSVVFGQLPKGYRSYKRFQLSEKGQTIELVVDKRISDTRLKQIGTKPSEESYRNGMLRLLSQGKELSSVLLKKSIVGLEIVPYWPNNNLVFLVTEDWSASLGSYNGPITYLFYVGQKKLVEAESLASGETKTEKISLMRSLKTDWKIIKGSKTSFPEILYVSCRPDFDNPEGEFILTYTRFHTDGSKWYETKRKTHDFWESDGKFPLESLFPK